MLRVSLVVALATLAAWLAAPGSVADPIVTDDGEEVVGFHKSYRNAKGEKKKKAVRQFLVFYRGKWLTYAQFRAAVARCEARGGSECDLVDLVPIRDFAEQTAISLVARLRLPDPTPQFGPDPGVNEWKMLAVGFPVWLWTAGPATVTTSVSSGGETFTMTARRKSVTFAMGDGRSVTCNSMTPYSGSVKPGVPSPTCGYVYQKPSLPAGSYTVRSTVNWEVSWSVAGYSGVLPTTRTASRALPIGELVALNR